MMTVLLFTCMLIFLMTSSCYCDHQTYHGSIDSYDVIARDKPLHRVYDKHERERRGAYTVLLITHGTLSGAFDIYKYVRGCRDYPGFEDSLGKIDTLIKQLRTLRSEVNLAWSPVVEMNGYFDRMVSSLQILNKHLEKFESLQEDIILSLDPSAVNKIKQLSNQIKNDIAAKNASYIVDTDELTKRYMSELRFAFRLITNFEPLVKLIGKGVVHGIGKLYSRTAAAKAVNANPGALKRFINNLSERKAALNNWAAIQKQNFKLAIKTKFQSFLSKHSRLQSRWTKMTGSVKARARWNKVGKGLKIAAKGLYLGGYLAYDIYLGIKFFKECQDRKNRADEIARNLTAEKNIMIDMKLKINSLHRDINSNYVILKSELTNDSFIQYIETIYETIAKATPASDILSKLQNIKNFKEKINFANVQTTDALTNKLISALSYLNHQISCLVSQVKVTNRGVHDCANGNRNMSEVYINSKIDQNLIMCINYNHDKAKFVMSIKNEMVHRKLHKSCRRNSYDLKILVCMQWNSGTSINEIAQKNKLVLQDAQYLVSNCIAKELSETDRITICASKTHLTLDKTKETFSRFNPSEVESAYIKCSLSKTQINNICRSKSEPVSFNEIFKDYRNFGKTAVKTVYDKCVLAIPAGVKHVICVFKSLGFTMDSKALQDVQTKHDAALVLNVFNGC